MNKIYEFLNNAARQYYNGNPIISDAQFDRLADSIGYNAVGAKQHENTDKHYMRMYSLQKHYEDESNKSPLHGCGDAAITPKIDGAAISILYIDGQLSRVLTRGDGIEGRIVTDKFLATKLIPHTINAKFGPIVQIIGEIAAPKTVENSRNYAAGALNLKDPEEFRTRAVEFFAYGIYPYPTDTFDGDMQQLARAGFNTVQSKNIQEIYPTDGIVFRLNNNAEFEELGFTSKHPRGAYAKKERGVGVETTLIGVEWKVGKSGKVTPTALLEPVYIGDKLVSRATLNNPAFIEALDIRIGDRVAVILGGEIIPVITHKVGG
jgi:DNA ligase (NAD+)